MNELFLPVIAILLAAIGYFIKRIFDRSELTGADVADMKPKLNVLWVAINDIKPKVDVLWANVNEMKPKVDVLWVEWTDMKSKLGALWADKYAPAHSQRQLNDRGNAVFYESGIKEIIDAKKSDLFIIVKEKDLQNPYDAEMFIAQIMTELPTRFPDTVEKLKEGAFRTGVDINTVLFVGSIYLRDLLFSDLGFSEGVPPSHL